MRLKFEKGAQGALINVARQSDRRTIRGSIQMAQEQRLNLLTEILARN